ncbi:MAG: hypothetical protein COA63_006520 [Methylophaga sp.]|nr:hypothetical protein [Methylophaga sp.]
MEKWSLPKILEALHDDIQGKLTTVRGAFAHPGTKGDGSENVWLELFNTYLPKRYEAAKGHVVDSKGNFSDQLDVVVFDRQYSPFVFNYEGQIVIPAESVYAVFEAKQTLNKEMVSYAQSKITTVRKLYRTSLPIPYADGEYPAKPPIAILGGILTLESDWKPPLGAPLLKQLNSNLQQGCLNLGCVAAHGYFSLDKKSNQYTLHQNHKAATTFLFKLIAELQFSGTVPMIDIESYSKWLDK